MAQGSQAHQAYQAHQAQQRQQLSDLKSRATFNIKSKRQQAQMMDKIDMSCKKHPVDGFLTFTYDPSIDYSKTIKVYKFDDKGTVKEKKAKLATIPNGVYNFIIYADHDKDELRLVLTYMNPFELFTKHKNMLYHTKDIDLETFSYSGEIEFNGTTKVKTNERSSLYFDTVGQSIRNIVLNKMFPTVDSFRQKLMASAPATVSRFNSYEEKPGPIMDTTGPTIQWFLNKLPDVTTALEEQMQSIFMSYMTYALNKIFGYKFELTFDENLYGPTQRNFTVNFMNDICSSKAPAEYGPLYSDEECKTPIPDKTWCTYKHK